MNKKRTMKKGIGLTLVFALVLISSLTIISALGITSVCLKNGDTILFSKCNSAIADKTCTDTTCILCVNQISNGVYCPTNINACNGLTGDCVYIDQTTTPTTNTTAALPNITLISPLNWYETDVKLNVFSFKVQSSFQFEKCELIINNQSVGVINRPISTGTQTINYSLESGDYVWMVKCTRRTNYGGDVIYSIARNLLINTTSSAGNDTNVTNSQIGLILPEDSYSSTDTNVNFSFNFSNEVNLSKISSCNLTLNSASSVIENITLGLENNFSAIVSPGSYSWKVECSDNLGGIIASETRSLTINSVAQPSSGGTTSSGGGSGGGGGGSGPLTCTTNWTCTDWESCISGTQIRNCTLENSSCVAGKKPDMQQNCTGTLPVATNTTVEPSGFASGITGAVVGVGEFMRNNRIYVTIVFIVIVVVAFFVVRRYVKRDKEE